MTNDPARRGLNAAPANATVERRTNGVDGHAADATRILRGSNGHATDGASRRNGHAGQPKIKLVAKVDVEAAAEELRRDWEHNARWKGLRRDYDAADVVRLRGSVHVEHSIARRGSERLWHLLHEEPFVASLGALSGNQAVQMVRGGVQAIYLSGWQVAADHNLAGETFPDLSLYPSNSVPALVRAINNALLRADQIEHAETGSAREWLAPIVADAEAGFGGPLNAHVLMRQMIEAGAAAAHFEDQLASAKKCGHMGGKVLVPTSQHIRTLTAARLAADVLGVPSLLVARTDALGARLVSSDVDPRDRAFLTGERTPEGHYRADAGLEPAIRRSLAYAPYAELLWFETNKPDLDQAREFAKAIHRRYPEKMLAYNCSPSFHWAANLDADTIADFQNELGRLGYKFQFVTLAGFHAMNAAVFELARDYRAQGMAAYVRLQEREFAMQPTGYSAVQHQREVGTGYFDAIASVISPGDASGQALSGSTEEEQFVPVAPRQGLRSAKVRQDSADAVDTAG